MFRFVLFVCGVCCCFTSAVRCLMREDVSMQQEQRLRAIGLIPIRSSSDVLPLKTTAESNRLFRDSGQPIRLLSNAKRSVGRHSSTPATLTLTSDPNSDQGHFVHTFTSGGLMKDLPSSSGHSAQGRIRLRFRNLPESSAVIDRPPSIDSRPTSFASMHDFAPETFNELDPEPHLIARNTLHNHHFDMPPIDPLYRFAFNWDHVQIFK